MCKNPATVVTIVGKFIWGRTTACSAIEFGLEIPPHVNIHLYDIDLDSALVDLAPVELVLCLVCVTRLLENQVGHLLLVIHLNVRHLDIVDQSVNTVAQ